MFDFDVDTAVRAARLSANPANPANDGRQEAAISNISNISNGKPLETAAPQQRVELERLLGRWMDRAGDFTEDCRAEALELALRSPERVASWLVYLRAAEARIAAQEAAATLMRPEAEQRSQRDPGAIAIAKQPLEAAGEAFP